MTVINPRQYAEIAYAEYSRHLVFKNFKGGELPLAKFNDLPDHVQGAWISAITLLMQAGVVSEILQPDPRQLSIFNNDKFKP